MCARRSRPAGKRKPRSQATKTDFKAAGGDSFSREAIYLHCVGQAARYSSADIG